MKYSFLASSLGLFIVSSTLLVGCDNQEKSKESVITKEKMTSTITPDKDKAADSEKIETSALEMKDKSSNIEKNESLVAVANQENSSSTENAKPELAMTENSKELTKGAFPLDSKTKITTDEEKIIRTEKENQLLNNTQKAKTQKVRVHTKNKELMAMLTVLQRQYTEVRCPSNYTSSQGYCREEENRIKSEIKRIEDKLNH